VPVKPGSLIEPAAFSMIHNMSEDLIPNKAGQRLNIGIVTNIHDLGNDTLGKQNRLLGRFPPQVFRGEGLQSLGANMLHNNLAPSNYSVRLQGEIYLNIHILIKKVKRFSSSG
jgi:hypothetical protein